MRDAVYESLLKAERQRLHARIAGVLEERFLEAADAEPELLARHCTEAGLIAQAVEYWRKAGERALARSAVAEAVTLLSKGLAVLVGLPDDTERRRQELGLQVALGAALFATKGQAAPETLRAYARARDLCRQLGDNRYLAPVLFGLWASLQTRAELDGALDVGAELLALAERERDTAVEVLAHRTLGTTRLYVGEALASRTHLEKLLTLGGARCASAPVSLYPAEPHATGRAWLALALLVLGYPNRARAQADEALAEAQRLGHHNTTALVLFCRCAVYQLLRDTSSVASDAEMLLSIGREQSSAFWSAVGTVFQGWVLAAGQEHAAGIVRVEDGIAAYRATGAALLLPYWLALLAEAQSRAGRLEEAASSLAQALDRSDASRENWYRAELLRAEGERLRLAGGHATEAEARLRRALAVASEQGAKMWELRAATALARLLAEHGEERKAHDLLAPVYGWFIEGFDTADLKETRALLDELASTPPGSQARARQRSALR